MILRCICNFLRLPCLAQFKEEKGKSAQLGQKAALFMNLYYGQ